MEWHSDAEGEIYSTHQGVCQALVWHDTTGLWVALVKCDGTEVGHERFTALEAAWVWSGTQLADLVAAGRCNREAIP